MHLGGQVSTLGPVVQVHIGPSHPRIQALEAAEMAVPAAIVANLLIDTGASMTALNSVIPKRLGLLPTGLVPVHTPSTSGGTIDFEVFDVGLVFASTHAGSPHHIVRALPVTANGNAFHGFDGLLGRDVLAHARLIYSGFDQIFLLSF